MSTQVDVFAALEHIQDGDWDRYLLRLQAAIRHRIASDAYRAHIVAGKGREDQQ